MNPKAQLIFGRKKYTLEECSFDITNSKEPNNIFLMFDYDGDKKLLEWINSNTQTRDGKVVFFKENGTEKFSFNFHKGNCTKISFLQSELSTTGAFIELKIIADKISSQHGVSINDFPNPCKN